MSRPENRCQEHGEPFPCSQPIWAHWGIEDGEDGWYVVRPLDQGRCGPFTESEAMDRMEELKRDYPMTVGVDWASGEVG